MAVGGPGGILRSQNFAIVAMGFLFPGYDSHGSDLPPRSECAPLWRQRVMDAMPQIEWCLRSVIMRSVGISEGVS